MTKNDLFLLWRHIEYLWDTESRNRPIGEMFFLFVIVWCSTFIVPLACGGGGGGGGLVYVRFPMFFQEPSVINVIGTTIEEAKNVQRNHCHHVRGKGIPEWEEFCATDFSKVIVETNKNVVVEDQLPKEMWDKVVTIEFGDNKKKKKKEKNIDFSKIFVESDKNKVENTDLFKDLL
jgi:hypothetical protein